MAGIYISTIDRKTKYELPILPENMPTFQKQAEINEFESYKNGKYTFIKHRDLNAIALEFWLPDKKKKYEFQKKMGYDPFDLITFLNNRMKNQYSLKVVIARVNSKKDFINQQMAIESFTYYQDKVGDIQVNLSLKEYRSAS